MNKKRARRIFSAKRDKLTPAEKERAEEKIEENLFSAEGVFDAEHYFVYLSFKSEVSTANIISRLISRGKKVYVPKMVNGRMLAVKISGGMTVNGYGIAEPKDTVEAERIDVCITPLVAADEALNRVGYGKGCYDRFFEEHPSCVKIGLCFAAQVSKKKIETEATDVPLDYLITEKGTEKRRVENI